MTPYKFAKAYNELSGENLPPQMFYTYAKKGMIASHKDNEGKIVLEKEGPKGYDAWILKRIDKANTKKVEYEVMTEEYLNA